MAKRTKHKSCRRKIFRVGIVSFLCILLAQLGFIYFSSSYQIENFGYVLLGVSLVAALPVFLLCANYLGGYEKELRDVWSLVGKKEKKPKRSVPSSSVPINKPIPEDNKTRQDEEEYAAVLRVMPYKQDKLMTPYEKKFYYVLRRCLDARGVGYILSIKPCLKEFIRVFDYNADDVHKRAWREISQKHVDFLVCASDGEPFAAIEYDGSTHDKNNSQNAATIRSDAFKDKLFKEIGVTLVRVPYGNWSVDKLSALLNEAFDSQAAAS